MRASGRHRRLLGHAAALAAALALLSACTASSASASQSDYQRAYSLGLRAYKYGLPLVEMAQTFRTQTSVEKPTHRGYAPVNSFTRARLGRRS